MRISCIIVTYLVELAVICRQLEVILPQVENVILVDNGSKDDIRTIMPKDSRLSIVVLEENVGLATAQNIGIERARVTGCDHVILLDQDSLPAENMVEMLSNAAKILKAQNIKYSCIGPNYIDSRLSSIPSFVRMKGLRLVRIECVQDTDIVETDFLIASGSLIPLSVLDVVGKMADELFIDYIDIEWGLRARGRGYLSFGVCAARMNHALGDRAMKLGWRAIPIHRPFRQYYNVRNAIWLMRRNWLPWRWRSLLLMRVVWRFFFFSFLVAPRAENSRMMRQGIADAMTNRMGKLKTQ